MGYIKIIIDKNSNNITVEGIGYVGTTCIKDIDELTKVLQATTVGRKTKPEAVALVKEVVVSEWQRV